MLSQLEEHRGLVAGFVPDNSWHVLLPADAADAARARLKAGASRLVSGAPRLAVGRLPAVPCCAARGPCSLQPFHAAR
jgi:hypothetical protein